MKASEFKAARLTLGLTQAGIGRELGDENGGYSWRTIASWEAGERRVPPAVRRLIRLLVRVHIQTKKEKKERK